MFEHVIQSPVGPLTLTGTEDALTRLSFGGGQAGAGSPSPALELAARELEEYFAGVRREFTVPLAPEGTAFQLAVWSALREIPYRRAGDQAVSAAPGGAATRLRPASAHRRRR